jgi:hypothetical protein
VLVIVFASMMRMQGVFRVHFFPLRHLLCVVRGTYLLVAQTVTGAIAVFVVCVLILLVLCVLLVVLVVVGWVGMRL